MAKNNLDVHRFRVKRPLCTGKAQKTYLIPEKETSYGQAFQV